MTETSGGASPKPWSGMPHAAFHEVHKRWEQLREDHRDHHPGDDFCEACDKDWPCDTEVVLRRTAMVEAEHAALVSMVEKAASTLRELAGLEGDELDIDPDVIRSMARSTLKAMREIGGFDV